MSIIGIIGIIIVAGIVGLLAFMVAMVVFGPDGIIKLRRPKTHEIGWGIVLLILIAAAVALAHHDLAVNGGR